MSEVTPEYKCCDTGGCQTPENVRYTGGDEPQVFEWEEKGRRYLVEVWSNGQMIEQVTCIATGQTHYTRHNALQVFRVMAGAGEVTAYAESGGELFCFPGAPSALAYALSRTWVRQ